MSPQLLFIAELFICWRTVLFRRRFRGNHFELQNSSVTLKTVSYATISFGFYRSCTAYRRLLIPVNAVCRDISWYLNITFTPAFGDVSFVTRLNRLCVTLQSCYKADLNLQSMSSNLYSADKRSNVLCPVCDPTSWADCAATVNKNVLRLHIWCCACI